MNGIASANSAAEWTLDPQPNKRGADLMVGAPFLAGATGIEPAISGLTGRRVNRYTTPPGYRSAREQPSCALTATGRKRQSYGSSAGLSIPRRTRGSRTQQALQDEQGGIDLGVVHIVMRDQAQPGAADGKEQQP